MHRRVDFKLWYLCINFIEIRNCSEAPLMGPGEFVWWRKKTTVKNLVRLCRYHILSSATKEMAPNRFVKERKAREVTPYREEPPPASIVPVRPTTPHPDRQPSPLLLENPADRPVTPAPPEWSSYDAPINFTWVIPDELCGMGWPKSRDQVRERGYRWAHAQL